MIYIQIEDLAANAAIELLKREKAVRIPLTNLYNYGKTVVSLLNQKDIRAVLQLDKYSTMDFIDRYDDIFRINIENEEDVLTIVKGTDSRTLWGKFRGYLSVDVMLEFMKDDAVKELITE